MNTIFISHIQQEAELSEMIGKAIEDEFYQVAEVFNTSDGKSVRTGEDFIKKIDEALQNCKYAIFIVGPDSVNAKWINFEFGAVAMRNLNLPLNKQIPMAPLCHSGMTIHRLGKPLDSMVGKVASDQKQLEELFRDIAAKLELEK